MGVMTLAEHKAATAAEEARELESTPQVEEEELEDEAPEVEEEAEQESTEVAATDEDSDDKPEAKESEAWMQSGDEDPQSDDLNDVPDAAWAAIRKSQGAKFERKEEKLNEAHKKEMDELRAQVNAMQSGNQPAQVANSSVRPKRDDFYHLDNSDDAYDDAVYAWRTASDAAKGQKAIQQKLMSDQKAAQDLALDDHYSEAEKLCRDNGIEAEKFQQTDVRVRTVLGVKTVNALITTMGKGSGKVFFNVGINEKRLGNLKRIMEEDPTGLKAMMYLGEIKTELNPRKRKSLAPKPATTVKGDKNSSRSDKASKKAYDKAAKNDDVQKRFDIKREAKANGVDTRNW